MKIAVDASQLHSNYTGVGRYIYNILKNIAKIDPNIEYILISNRKINIDFNYPNISQKVLRSLRKYIYWANTLLAEELRKSNYDLFWAPNYYLPFFFKGKSILTIHDVSWKALPDNFSFVNRVIKNLLANRSIKRASSIITDSEFSKKEILRYYKSKSELINVIHLGIDPSYKKADKKSIQNFKLKHKINNSKVIGFLGSMFKRRNIDTIIYSFEELKKSYPELKLLLIGEIYHKKLHSLIDSDRDIIWIKRIPEEDIRAFYSSLDLFIFLSEYEGFGFPPLESLKCGTVPIILNKTSLNELYKDFSLLLDSAKKEVLTEIINDFFINRESIEDRILTNFFKRENYFNWDRAAKQHLEIFKRICL